MVPGRQIFWNIQFGELLYILTAIVVIILVYSLYRHYKRWRVGGPANRFNNLGKRVWTFLVIAIIDGLLHRKFFGVADGLGHGYKSSNDLVPREFYIGLAHWLMFIGCVALLLGAFLDFISHYFFGFMKGSFYLGYSVVTDSFGILVAIGVILAVIRRYGQKPDRLDNKQDDLVVLLLILIVVVTGFIVEGLRIAVTELKTAPQLAPWSPGGYVVALAFSSLSRGTLLTVHVIMWWFHTALVLGTFLYVSLYSSKLFHIIWGPVNVFFRNLEAPGALVPIDLKKAKTVGVSKIEGFNWKQLMDLDACTRCGRCQDICPAHFSGKALNPKKIIQDLKTNLYEVHPILVGRKPAESRKDMISEVVSEEVVWDCTTCRACDQVCPVYIEHVDKIIDMRRSLVMDRCKYPEEVHDTLKSLRTRGHPFRGTTAERTTWFDGLELPVLAEGSNPDVLYWVGCAAALEDRNMSVPRAMVKILRAAGVNFGILGAEENCCGDPARRIGDEYLYQTICESNIEVLKGYNVKKILTTCPHCFNTLKHEYSQFGGNFEVIHHTQFICDLLRNGRLKLSTLDHMKIAYHDPCYLGRYNGIYQEPRTVSRAISSTGVVELSRSGTRSFCCGGGGGHMWMEEDPGKRVNQRRVEEIVQAKADIVATACPYCLTMLEDGVKAKGVGGSLQVKDLSELVAEALGKD